MRTVADGAREGMLLEGAGGFASWGKCGGMVEEMLSMDIGVVLIG